MSNRISLFDENRDDTPTSDLRDNCPQGDPPQTSAEQALEAIMAYLVQPSMLIDEWLAVHGTNCECNFCTTCEVEYVEEALRALAYVVNTASADFASFIRGGRD